MPNKFKYNKTGAEANSIFKGNWAIDNTPINVGGGPSSSTGFYNGANIPAGGYAIYSPTSVFIANNDAELVGKINSLGAFSLFFVSFIFVTNGYDCLLGFSSIGDGCFCFL